MSYSYSSVFPRQVVFGPGTRRRLGSIARTFGRSALLVCGRQSLKNSGCLDEIRGSVDDAGVSVVDLLTVSGEPQTHVIDAAVMAYAQSGAEFVVAVGGGSVMDAGKAIAAMLTVRQPVAAYLERIGSSVHPGTTLPLIAVPTTAGSGSEATKNAVLTAATDNGHAKVSLRHDNFVPVCVLVDPELHLTCPASVTAACGMDALTQLIEAYVSTHATPLSDALAWSGLEHAARALVPAATDHSRDIVVRSSMAYAALLSGMALAQAGLGVVHGIAPVLGAVASVPHSVACGTLLAAATEAIVRRLCAEHEAHPAIEKYASVGRLLSGKTTPDPRTACAALVATLRDWAERLRIPTLSAYGITPADCSTIASLASNRNSPIALTAADIAEILSNRIT